MAHHKLEIAFDAHEGAMLRLMGLIQRRGFTVEAIDMPQREGLRKTATLTVAPMGPGFHVEVLQRQIERLQEIRDVKIAAPEKSRNILRFFKMKPAVRSLETSPRA
jgi:acetolactate synthase regulatory subunit